MKSFLLRSSILLITMFSSVSSFAYDDNDKKEFIEYVDLVSSSAQQGEFSPMINRMSPALIEMVSEKMGMSSQELIEFMTKISTSMMSADKYDLSQLQYTANFEQVKPYTSTTGREYAVIPIKMVLVDDDNRYLTTSNLVAVQEDGEWYFNRVVGASQIAMFKQVYPDITELDLPESKSEVVSK